MTKNRPGYFEGYYKENREDILKARRERYASDPEYRDRVLKSSRDYRKKQRRDPRVRTKRYQKPISGVSADGTEVKLCSVGALSVLLQRSVQSINHWQKKGLIPPTPYRDNRGFRFYTVSMMHAIKREVAEKRRLFPVDQQMVARIAKAWREDGIPIDYNGEDIEEAIRLTTKSLTAAA